MNKTTFKQLVGNMNQKELMEIICQMAQADSIAEQILLDYCQKNATRDNKNLILEKQLKKHWMNAYRIIEEANTYGGCSDSDEEEVYDEIEIIQKIIAENEISWNIRKDILDSMLEQIAYDNSSFTDVLVDIAKEFCHTNDELEYLADFLADKGSHYYKAYAASLYNKIGVDDKFLETKKANLEYGSDYLELADYYKNHGKKELALQTVWDGLDKCNGRLDEIYRYLFKWYHSKGDEATLWKLYKKALTKRWDIECITELMCRYCKEKQDYQHQ